MSNEINQNEVARMLKETANFCRDVKQIFDNLSAEIGGKNLQKEYETFFYSKDGWLCYDFCFESNKTINGFRLLIATGDSDENRHYLDIAKQLRIDKDFPFLLVYGCFNPIQSIQKSIKTFEAMMDICCGLITDHDEEYFWINFNKNQIALNQDILVEIKEWSPEIAKENSFIDWEDFFSRAKIKYKPLLELQSFEDIKQLADEIKTMTF